MVSKQSFPDLNLIVLGSPEAGRATTVGQLLYKIAAKSSESLERLNQQAELLGKTAEDPAWILDNFKDQKEIGEESEEKSPVKITTAKNQFNITEVNGHKNFLQNIINSAPAIDAALLVISAKAGEFEASITNDELFYHHAVLAFALGVKRFIVAVNKFETEDETRFKEIQETISERLKKATNLGASHFTFVPISALKGENLTEKSADLAWYKGPTLLEAFEAINPTKLADKPLRFPLQDVYKIGGIEGPVAVGRVESGTLRTGSEICFAPSDITTKVVSFETIQGGINDEALPGWNMGFAVEQKIKKEDLHRGYVCGELKNDPPRETLSFEAYVYFNKDSEKIQKERKITIDCHTAHVVCEVVEIKEKINKRDGSVAEQNPEFLGVGDFALVKFVPTKPVCVEAFGEYSALGRFGMRGEQTQNIGIGLIKSVEKKAGAKGK